MAMAKLSAPDWSKGEDGSAAAAPTNVPRYGPGVTITSSSQKAMQKFERKQQRKGAAGGKAAPGAGGLDTCSISTG